MKLNRLSLIFLTPLFLSCQFFTAQLTSEYSNIYPDEEVTIFPQAAHLSADGKKWQVPVQAWVYELDDRGATKAIVRALLRSRYDLEVGREHEDNFSRRSEFIFADSESAKQIIVNIAGTKYILPRTPINGISYQVFEIPVAEFEPKDSPFIPVTVVMPPGDERVFTGRVFKEPDCARVIISDIDDTVKITGAMNRRTLYENTFLEDFQAVDGMANIYNEWQDAGWQFHYVSSSPAQLFTPLSEFLEDADFPPAIFHLKMFRFSDSTFLNLFRSATITKPPAIRSIIDACAGCRFILVGDSGQEDPEVYSQILEEYPQKISAVAIRNVSDDNIAAERYRLLLDHFGPQRFILFDEPSEIEQLGLNYR